ncbi:D-alanine--D-alanine ligase [Oceanospirillum linum]|uniref:D-alanine--D-alanine ligase n=1 Tax=Oceanospirillum linum TaxID=966 RepID=A0A1T1HF39_OCELI|nr:D-alanine--D-alanine ligase [Oceanospirillum linum]OOV88425.1 D-alanine--D-alanine ligase [Oceanospirillum linum]SEF55875.1 D-alanine--D-alanine ligase [Oleiphilus messinensis]SMP05333.1 D-alanine--D-alanine ligase [Oceanospirillum linum]
MSEFLNPESPLRVAVLYGGTSAERDVSLNSGQAVIAALKTAEIDVIGIDINNTGDWLPLIQQADFDIAFLALHGRGGEDGTIQGLLECLGIPYTGSGVLGSALAMDKLKTKQVWQTLGLPTPGYCWIDASTDLEAVWRKLDGMPLMVKPVHEGSSIGMSKVDRLDQLQDAVAKASDLDSCVFVEQWVTGKEFTVSILNGEALPVIGLETNHQFYDYEAKYLVNDTRYLLPCGLSPEEERELQALSLRAFNAVGCQDWGRVDLMLNEKGEPQLLEVNTLPGMTDHSLVPMAAQAKGYSFSELVLAIIQAAKQRYGF